MNKGIRYALLAFGLMAMQSNLFGRDIPLIAGNLIQCTINEPDFSSRSAKVGEPLICYARPLREFGCSGFPRGTQLAGRLVDYRDPGRFFGKGWLRLEFDRLILPSAETTITAKVISVDGFKVDREGRIRGRGHPKRDALGWAIPILWPIKLIRLPGRGPWPTLKDERLVTLRLLDDLHLPCEERRTALSESRWRPFPSSSSIYLGSSNSRAEPPRYGVWYRFDGREVGAKVDTPAATPGSRETEKP